MNKTQTIIEKVNSLFELNNETNTFTHDGNLYNLTALNRLVKNLPVQNVDIKQLIWIFRYDNPLRDEPQRIHSANLNIPILITRWQNKWVVLDGLHRIKKAQLQHWTHISAKIVPHQMLDKTLVSTNVQQQYK